MKGSLRENHTQTRHVLITILLWLVGFTSTLPSSEVSNMFSPGGVWENVHRCRSETFTWMFLFKPSSQVPEQRVKTESRTTSKTLEIFSSPSPKMQNCACVVFFTLCHEWNVGLLCVCKSWKCSNSYRSHVPYRHFCNMYHTMRI